MKKHRLFLMVILSLLFLLVISQVYADSLVGKHGSLKPDNPTTEEAWLTALLGFDPGNYLGKDEKGWNDGNWTEGTAGVWTYAVLKYGAGWKLGKDYDHMAIYNEDGGTGVDFGVLGLGDKPTKALSHITYFGTTPVPPAYPVPEPATMLLLCSGLVGLAGLSNKKFLKH
jgi:hypothetical protein